MSQMTRHVAVAVGNSSCSSLLNMNDNDYDKYHDDEKEQERDTIDNEDDDHDDITRMMFGECPGLRQNLNVIFRSKTKNPLLFPFNQCSITM